MLLADDRNLTGESEPENGILKLVPGHPVSWTETMHVNQGNIGLADGSVGSFPIPACKMPCKTPATRPTPGKSPCRNDLTARQLAFALKSGVSFSARICVHFATVGVQALACLAVENE